MVTIEQIAAAVTPYGRLRSVTININNRCPLKCKHCSVGFSEDHRGSDYKIAVDDLCRKIAGINPEVYDMVLLAGGEPSLDPELLQVAIENSRKHGMLSGVVTAPIWAGNAVSAARFLDKMVGLDVLILSFDRYHLEFLRLAHYENAVRAAAERSIFVQILIVHTEDAEKRALVRELDHIAHLLNIHALRAVPVGNAATQLKRNMEAVTVHSVDDLKDIPRGCILGNVHVDEHSSVHGCCWSRTVRGSPFSVNRGSDRLCDSLRALERDACFQAVREHGFIDGLNELGRAALAARFAGRNFVSECDICLSAMDSQDESIWGQHRSPTYLGD